jgi:hypothetical protein
MSEKTIMSSEPEGFSFADPSAVKVEMDLAVLRALRRLLTLLRERELAAPTPPDRCQSSRRPSRPARIRK